MKHLFYSLFLFPIMAFSQAEELEHSRLKLRQQQSVLTTEANPMDSDSLSSQASIDEGILVPLAPGSIDEKILLPLIPGSIDDDIVLEKNLSHGREDSLKTIPNKAPGEEDSLDNPFDSVVIFPSYMKDDQLLPPPTPPKE